MIFVVVRYTQIDAILDTLRASRAKNIIFVGNNVRAAALAALLQSVAERGALPKIPGLKP